MEILQLKATEGIIQKPLMRLRNKSVSILLLGKTTRRKSPNCFGHTYGFFTLQAIRVLLTGRQALQEIHSALSGPSPERQRLGRSGWPIRGLEIETKSATLEVKISSIL
ncbi:MAG: hypothetical protein ACXU99_11160, partial [Thermodesulfobacteriota bacterium]